MMSGVTVEDQPSAEPRTSLRSATAWSYGLNLGRLGISTAISLVLAAMLGPRAFGVIAMALVFVNFIEMLQQQGMMPAIIVRKPLRTEHCDTAFWMIVGVGLVCTVIGVAIAPLWANVNQLPELAPVIQVLALSVPLSSSVVVHEALLRRNLEFKKLAIRSWAAVLAGGVAGVSAASLGWGVWALVAQQLVMTVTTVAALWVVTAWRPRFQFSPQAARQLWSYAYRAAIVSLGVFFGGRIDVLFSGALFGPVILGIYRMAHRVTSTAIDLAARSMQGVTLSALAADQDRPVEFARQLNKMQRFTASLSLPALGVLIGIAPVVEHLLGEEWTGAALATRILALAHVFATVTLLLGPALQAKSLPGTLAVVVWGGNIIGVALLLVAASVPTGGEVQRLTVLCAAMALSYLLGASARVVVACRYIGLPFRGMLQAWLPGTIAGLAATGTSWLVMSTASSPAVPAATIAGSAGLAAAGTTLMLVDRDVRSLARRVAQRSLRKRDKRSTE